MYGRPSSRLCLTIGPRDKAYIMARHFLPIIAKLTPDWAEEIHGLAFLPRASGKARSGDYGTTQLYMLINTSHGADDIGGDQSSEWCIWIDSAHL